MQQEKIEEIRRHIDTCLQPIRVDIQSLAAFCHHLKTSCEELRSNGSFKGKKDEQDFCSRIVKMIASWTQLRACDIFAESVLHNQEKADLLTNLTYISQTLIALTGIQHRFGGRLGYHCLPHTRSIAQYPDFMILCAGANHDCVMRYAPSPDFHNPLYKETRLLYHLSRNQPTVLNSSKMSAHRAMLVQNKDRIKTLKGYTEQKRIAGWGKGHSEHDSFCQMEIQLADLIRSIENCEAANDHRDVILCVKKQIQSTQSYREGLIKGTIPTICDFAPPGLGDKLNTIGNVSVFPGPDILSKMEQPLRARLIDLMDSVIKEIKGPEASTFQIALDDISDARTFYCRVTEAEKTHPEADLEELKNDARIKLQSEGRGSEVPHFETMNETILAVMPPFNDPMKQLIDVSQDTVVKSICKAIREDVAKHNDLILVKHLMCATAENIVGSYDLGTMMMKGAENYWLHNEVLGLIFEENPYQSRRFFTVNRKLQSEGGLASEEVHAQLKIPEYRAKWNITEDEYTATLEFMDLAYYFINENFSFCQGAILRTKFYIHLPMSGLKMALEDPLILGRINNDEKKQFNSTVQEFEDFFCINGRLRDSILREIKAFIDSCAMAGSLCKCIIEAMKHQFGPHFLKEPQEYGFTSENEINKEFLEEQNRWHYE